jgi:hypothetical protein
MEKTMYSSSILNASKQAVNFVRDNTPTLASPNQMVKNAQRIALPVIALVGIGMMHEAQAVTTAECFENCDSHRDAHHLMKLFCYTLCLIFAKD